MKRILALYAVFLLLASPICANAQDARTLQASKVMQFALLLMSADHQRRANINEDSAGQISTALPEISRNVADNIVAHRTNNGRFQSLLDLLEVPGVDRDVVTRNRHRIFL